ncbi:hypothetical protein [Peribacillus sp. NPDC058075]|uniref:hypothetical protein n=1 Tax=unclassified Peribacillus TaxID=2675266 RepID=UPI0036D95231
MKKSRPFPYQETPSVDIALRKSRSWIWPNNGFVLQKNTLPKEFWGVIWHGQLNTE